MFEIEPGSALYDHIYTPEIVMTRVRHLRPDERRKVELVTRVIRARFDPGTMIEPRPRISRIMLVPPEFRPGKRPPDFEFWVILTDRLFTKQRLWRSVRREIRSTLGDDCHVWLSFGSAYWFKHGKESDDEFITERVAAGITLYNAKDDDPLRRRPHKRSKRWKKTLAAYEKAAGARHRAELSLLNTPAPDLAVVIRKLEILTSDIPGAGPQHLIFADLRRLALRGSAEGGGA